MSMRGWSLLVVTLLLSCLAACGKAGSDSSGTANAATNPSSRNLKLPEASRKFLTVEPVGGAEPAGGRAYFGRVAFRPKALSAVTAPFAGRIATVLVEPGQSVSAGTALFTIESADVLQLRTSLEQARIKLQTAEVVLARQEEMMKRGVGLEVERFDAEMKVREARSEAERAGRNAALAGAGSGTQLSVRSPVDGVVVSVKATRGATVQPGGDPLVEVGNPGGLWVVGDVPEGEAAQLAKGQKAEVQISALNLTLAGRVAGVAPRSDPETRRAPFYVELEKAPAELRAGLLVRIGLAAKASTSELWLPVTAVLLKDGGRRVVYVEDKDGGLAPREVEVGDQRGGQVRVLKGLQAGERVVMRGALLVDREAEQLL
jgi:cobalt-zinc-cadmium efflux system membrane fusion protein